ncbi:MAG: MBL fold metallo-hydrolase [Defluviitaleaceae bacterium]|nr:MBL fold metallo-hydrolase [Defluviitaleaceae bacterium]
MQKKEIAPNIIHYMFPPKVGGSGFFGTVTVALVSENRALLVDAGYEGDGCQIKDDLAKQGIVVEKIVLSHFHDDHMEGAKAFPDAKIYGSRRFQETLDLWTPKEEHKFYTPAVAIEKPFML